MKNPLAPRPGDDKRLASLLDNERALRDTMRFLETTNHNAPHYREKAVNEAMEALRVLWNAVKEGVEV